MKRVKTKRNEKLAELLREDGRPEVYDVADFVGPSGEGYVCFVCNSQGQLFRRYRKTGEIFMSSPVNTPGNQALLVCQEHLPDNAVIFSPFSGMCRNKTGDHTWKE